MTTPRTTCAVLLLPLALAGCSEWSLFARRQGNTPPDTDTGETLATCDQVIAQTTVPTQECRPPVIPIEPYVEQRWTLPSNCVAGRVLPTHDDNRDGRVDEHDVPTLIARCGTSTEDGLVFSVLMLRGDDGRRRSLPDYSVKGAPLGAPTLLDSKVGPEIILTTHDGFHRLALLTGEVLASASWDSVGNTQDLHWAHFGRAHGLCLVAGRTILDLDLNVVGRGLAGKGSFRVDLDIEATASADFDGDGVGEYASGNSIYRANGSLKCLGTHPDGRPFVADFDQDGLPEVFSHWRDDALGTRGASVMDGDCTTLVELDWAIAGMGAVGPLLDQGSMGIVIAGSGLDSNTGEQFEGITIHSFPGSLATTLQMGGIAADLDGDGRLELIWDPAGGARETEIFDVATESIIATLPGSPLVVADVDGDGAIEIITSDPTGGDLLVYGADWAPGSVRSLAGPYLYPALTEQDGNLTPPPHDWKHLNLRYAMIDESIRNGVGADPVVEIANVCTEECDRDRAVVTVVISNHGTVDLIRPLRVLLYGQVAGQEVLLGEQQVA